MGSTSTVSIVIPTYRRAALLRNLLKSLSAQETRHGFEVIVVNDGSDPDLATIETESSGMPTKLVRLGENRGRSFARNEGVRKSKGEIIIFVDDDMTVNPGFVQAHVEMHQDPRDVVIGDVVSPPEYKSHPLARYVERQGIHKLGRTDKIPPKCVRTGNVSVSRTLFDEAGQFSETICKYGEDLDLGMKLGYAGANFKFAAGAVSYHHHPPDIDDMIEKMQEYGRYTVPLLARDHPELKRAIKIHLAEPVRPWRENPFLTLEKIGLRLILVPPCYRLALGIYQQQWLGRLLFPVIDYIRAYNYIRGYWQAVRQ
ncbi:MAG TPA: glycosyltransferase family A protein [bacterium]|nr:glycosyltransferase family A protein [bacterium]